MISLEMIGKTECLIMEIVSIKKNQMEILELKHKITKIFKKSNGWQIGDNRGKSQG